MPLSDIETIVFVMLENRSFDHALGYLSTSAGAPPLALPVDGVRDDPAWLAAHANPFDGRRFEPHALTSTVQLITDPPHGHAAIAQQLGAPAQDGGALPMDGFVSSYVTRSRTAPADPSVVMGYYMADSVPTFDFFARNFAVCDHWYASLPTGTQPNRLMAMSGKSEILDNAAGLLPDQPLVYDWLTARNVPWCAYQYGGFFPFFSLSGRFLPEIVTSLALSALGGKGRFRRYDRFRNHWRGSGPMPNVIFVEPEYTDGPHLEPNDDHPPTGIGKGQAFLAELYDVLTSNPARWRNTMMVVTYDEHGGFYDHVPPLPIPAVAGGTALATTGVRVPALIVSPHVAPGLPFHDPLDHTSFLQLLADRFAPGQGYSAEVDERHRHLGRLSTLLTQVPADAPPPARPDPAALVAMNALRPPSAGTADSIGAARTTRAFQMVTQKMTSDHPELLDGPGWSSLAAHLRTQGPTA